MNHNSIITRDQGANSQEARDGGRIGIARQNMGSRYDLDLADSIYPLSEIGLQDEQNGVKFAVVDEITIPERVSDEGAMYGSSIAVLGTKDPKGQPAYLLMGLRVDDKGRKIVVPGSEHWLYAGDGGVRSASIGRNPDGVDMSRLIGHDVSESLAMSSKHLKFVLNDNGKLHIDVTGTNGIWSFGGNNTEALTGEAARDSVVNHGAGQLAVEAAVKPEALQAIHDALNNGNEEWAGDYINRLEDLARKIVDSGGFRDAEIVRSVICDNMIDGVELPEIMGKTNATTVYDKKGQLLAIYQNDPDLAERIVKQNIVGFHASNSASLWGVLQHGLLSAAELRARGHNIGSGERTFSKKNGESTIRFADWRAPRTIEHYSVGSSGNTQISPELLEQQAEEFRKSADANKKTSLAANPSEEDPYVYNALHVADDMAKLADFLRTNPESDEAKLVAGNFPVAYGLSANGYTMYARVTSVPKEETPASMGVATKHNKVIVEIVPSDATGEFMVYGSEVPKEDIPIIAVPNNRISQVRPLVEKYAPNTVVVALESLIENSYTQGMSAFM